MKVYIRFSDNIEKDRERGFSNDMHGNQLSGLCAWGTPYFFRDEFSTAAGEKVEEIDLVDYANEILRNTYGSYSSNDEAHVITGNYVGQGNDGVLLTDIEVLTSFKTQKS